MMIVCVPEKRIHKLVVFRMWPWNNGDVKSLLKMISVQLRRLVLDEGIKMAWQRHKELAEKEELESPVWPIPFKNESSGDLAVVKFFEEQP